MSTTGQLQDRVALVTGGAWGIGRGISLAMAAAGARVAVVDQNPERGEATAAGIRGDGGEAIFLVADVSDKVSVKSAVDAAAGEWGGLDILVNNAGIPGVSNPVHELDAADWDRVIAVNLRGPFLCAKHAIPHLLKSSHAAIVNIASTFGMIGAHGTPAYAASKGGVISLTRQLAIDYTPLGIRVNAISPGYIDTDMADRRLNMAPDDAAAHLERRNAAAALQPIGRQAQPGEIGAVAAFLASDAASFMTGAIVPVDGGCTASFNIGRR